MQCTCAPVWVYNCFRHYLINTFFKIIEHKMFVTIVSTTFDSNISHYKNSTMYQQLYIGIYVKYRLFLSIFNET
jgi:hypothetical protein